MNSNKRLFITALLCIALLTTFALWQVQISPVLTTADRLAQGSALRVGFAVERPYAFYNSDGHVTGEAPETFQLMAKRIGIKRIEWVRLDFASLLPELRLGRIDAIASGMFITPERQLEAAFTRPTAAVRPALVVRQGDTRLALQPTMNDLGRASDLRWIKVQGAVEKQMLLQSGVLPQQIKSVPNAGQGLDAVAKSGADVFAISAVTASMLVSQNFEQTLDTRVVIDGPVGLPAFAFRTADASMRDAMNVALLDFLGSDEHMSLVKRFGFTQNELPPSMY